MSKKNDVFKVMRKARKGPEIAKPRVYAMPKGKEIARLIARAKKINEQLAEVKPLYNELDQITFALAAVRKDKLDFYGVAIVDNFAAKNTQFKTVAMRRFDLEWRMTR